MGEQKAHINYSLEDIERYLKGNMSAKEMHEMERAALQDPFLADAIEGYSNASLEQSHKHLNEIAASLQAEKEDTKVVPLPSKGFYWWRVAAIIILVVGIGAGSWYITNLNNAIESKNTVAAVEENKTVNNDTVTKQAMSDTTNTSVIAQNMQSKSFQQKVKKDSNKEKRGAVVNSALSDIKSDTQKSSEDALADSFTAEDKKDVAANVSSLNAPQHYDTVNLNSRSKTVPTQNKQYLFLNNNALNDFKGRVTDNNNQPVPNAIVIADSQRVVYTDANGYFKLKAPDSLLNVTVSSIGYASRDTLLKSNNANNIAIAPDKNALSEVAVTGYGTKKQSMKRKANADSAYPSGGWESFQEYVYKKLGKPLDTLNGNEITGDVQIEFSIDKNGIPYNFNVIKSENDETASKAIEIIKEGPRWIATPKNKKGKVTIQF
jgi:hypothetical protein